MDACPVGAIEVDPKTNARVINAQKCTGCMTCVKACPWAMISFNEETKKATKCDLCGGDPQCVKWCPSGAMTVAAWRDRSKDTPVRQVVPASIPVAAEVSATCVQCHPTKK
jgi:Fe-S-cluster-containing hydrogenase component 2